MLARYIIENRKFRDLDDAYSKLPCNLKVMAEVILNNSQPESVRIDFMSSLSGQKHPAIRYILETISMRDDGKISAEAAKILKTYDTTPEFRSYNSEDEAISELPQSLRSYARRLISKDLAEQEFYSVTDTFLKSGHPAAAYIIEQSGAGHVAGFKKLNPDQ